MLTRNYVAIADRTAKVKASKSTRRSRDWAYRKGKPAPAVVTVYANGVPVLTQTVAQPKRERIKQDRRHDLIGPAVVRKVVRPCKKWAAR